LPQVWVDRDEDAARARELIDAYFRSGSAATGVLFCPTCGEENPGSFELCWACGAGLEQR
jgi:hypothetical protein